MNNIKTEIPANVFNHKLLSNLIIELNIAQRNFRSYPKGHPVTESSFRKVINCYNNLFNHYSSITMGVSRDSLMVGDEILDRKNRVFQDFAKTLYERGIAALTILPGLMADELRNFNVILSLKREDISSHGGIAVIWEKSRIKSMSIIPIQYDLFVATETESVSQNNQTTAQSGLWESFTRELMQGAPGTIKLGQTTDDLDADITPETLATILNRQMEALQRSNDVRFDTAFNSVIGKTFRTDSTGRSMSAESYDKLAAFVNALNPELRRKLLSEGFDIQSLSGGSIVEEIINRVSDETLIGTMDDIKQSRLNLPSSIMKLIERLSLHAVSRQNAYIQKRQKDHETNQKIRSIFCEKESEVFTPGSYQTILERIDSTDQKCLLSKQELAEIISSLNSHALETHLSDIILRLMILDDDENSRQQLVNNLSDAYYYLLETGDYEKLIYLIEQCDSAEIPPAIRQRLRSNYTSKECLEEMLVGLDTWGKAKYHTIQRLIAVIGEPFIEVLLDRLADEENLSLRRFIMDRLQEFGPLARNAIICRLDDSRWFVLRNLIILLRTINDSTVLEHVRHLMHNSNHRVRLEALRTCLYFQDPVAERQILYDMGSNDRETQLAAISMAEKSRSVDVFKKLLTIISRPGLSNIEFELKSAAIHALSEIGKAEAIPELAKLLAAKSLLNGRQLFKLKSDIIRSLRKYPPEIAKPVLQKLVSGGGELASQATETLKVMVEKTH